MVEKAGVSGSLRKRELSAVLATTITESPRSEGPRKRKQKTVSGDGTRSQEPATGKARDSLSHRTMRPHYLSLGAARGTCSCHFRLPPLQSLRTPEASSSLRGPGPGPKAAADLDGLSVVDFYHVEVKTVDPFARGDESAAF